MYIDSDFMAEQPNNQSSGRRIAKSTFYLYIRMIIVMGIGLYSSRVVLNVLGVEDYGIYNVVGGVVVFFSFLQQALNNATYRFIAYEIGKNDKEKMRKTFSMSVNAHLILSSIILFLAETVGLWVLNRYLVIPSERFFAAHVVYQFSILGFCANILRTPYNSAILSYERMNFYALTSILEAVLKLSILYLLLVFSYDKLILYSVLIFFISVVLLIWFIGYTHRAFEMCRYKRVWDKDLLYNMLNYSGWSLLVNGADIGIAQMTVIFFNMFFGVVSNAALGIANQVNGALCQLIANFTQAFNPQIIKIYAQGNRAEFIKLIYSTSKISYYLLFLCAIPILMNIDFVLELWLGIVPEGTGLFLIMIVLFSLVDAYSAPLWIAVHATGNIRTHQILMSSIKILNIPLAYILLEMGYAAWTVLFLKFLLNIVCSIVRPIYMTRLIQLPLKEYCSVVFSKIVLVTISTLPLPLVICSVYENGIIRLCLTSISFICIALISIFFLGLSMEEKRLGQNMIKSVLAFKKR